MEELKRVRRLLRRQFNKLHGELETIFEQEPRNEEELEVKFRVFEDNCDALIKNDEKILTELSKIGDNEAQDLDFDEMMEFRTRAEGIRVKRENLHRNQVDAGASDSLEATTMNPGQMRKFNLPPVTVKKFSGNLKDWLGFWSQFQKVDMDPTLDGSDKLFYLMQALEPGTDAYKIASGYPLTTENYPKVVEALKRRYGNEDLLLQVYIREILNIVTGKANTKERLSVKDLYLTLEYHLRALRTLNLKNADPESWLFPLVESCLSEEVQSLWHRSAFSVRDGSQENPPRTRLDFLMEFLEKEMDINQKIDLSRTFAAQQGRDKPARLDRPFQRENLKRKSHPPLLSSFPVTNQERCVFCERTNHHSRDCFQAQKLPLEKIKEIMKQKRLCYRCCGNHLLRNCDWNGKCSKCKGNHVRARCHQSKVPSTEIAPPPTKRSRTEEETPSTSSSANLECSDDVALQTVMVKIGDGRKTHNLRAFIDSGSQHSCILKSVAQKLSLEPTGYERVVHSTFGARTMEACHGKYEVMLKSLTGDFEVGIQLRDNVKLCGRIPNIAGKRPLIASELRAKGVELNDEGTKNSEVDLLIGADVYAKIITGNVVHLECGAVAIDTKVGWTLMGSVEPEAGQNMAAAALSMTVTDASITQLWDLELLGITDPMMEVKRKEKMDLMKEEYFKNISRLADGRYSVKLPWKEFRSQLPHNRDAAFRRLLSASKRLISMNLFKTYGELFEAWEKEGIIERVTTPTELNNVHYVPHRPVVKLESKTTPVRPVFDALTSGLNSYLEKGENYAQLLPHIIWRFRLKKIGFIADIRKAFLMIDVDRSDRDLMRFLWWANEKMDEIIEYRHARVMFGAVCSPFILSVVIQHHLSKLEGEMHEVGKKILDSIYVDNLVSSADNEDEYNEFRRNATNIFTDAKMDLRLWMSNIDGFNDENDDVVSVLGILWDRNNDELFINVKSLTVPEKVTKRKILSTIQKLFDPIGLISPAVLRMKILLQQTWSLGFKWDECIPENEAQLFIKWCKEISEIGKIRVPRNMTGNNRVNWQIHTFVDASQEAYAAVVFLRSEDELGNVSVNLIASKSRVAPIPKDKTKKPSKVRKVLTIPKLELMACVIGARLTNDITAALKLDACTKKYWSDSTTALTWISKTDQWNIFVENRCKEINELTDRGSWRFVPGNLNPADLPSRGCAPSRLTELNWASGPEFLYNDELAWPAKIYEINENEVMSERRRSSATMCFSIYDCLRKQYRFESMIKVMGWVRRFLRNILIKDKNLRIKGPLSDIEVDEAEKAFLREIQKEEFPVDERSALRNLEHIIDEFGIIRVKTRLTLLDELDDFKYPIVLPGSRPEVKQLIMDEHLRNCHAGVGTLLTILRKRFWILNGRRSIKDAIKYCYRCNRFRAKAAIPEPAPLPVDRIKDCEVFEVVGIDLAGPLILKNGSKVWLVIFTCAVYRAVHFEIVNTQSTRGFINALEKFIKKYRRPEIIYSDNGTNFRGAANLFDEIDWEEVEKFESDPKKRVKKILWKFNPVYSAWWGGWWERLIRSAKDLLKRMVGKGSLNLKELEYAIGAIKDVMNERPLTYVSEDINDLTPLTPAMFLNPLGNAVFPEGEMTEAERLRFRYSYMKTLQAELKNRARKEYRSMLVNRPQKKTSTQPKVGDMVLVGSDDKKRLTWPLGKILKLIPGKDNIHRLAEVKVEKGIVVRPLQRLFVLEMDDGVVEKNEVRTRGGRKVKIPTNKV